eukprot:scaffold2316_cov218-Pinguiococcus_pyrenoidosus.AAC.2
MVIDHGDRSYDRLNRCTDVDCLAWLRAGGGSKEDGWARAWRFGVCRTSWRATTSVRHEAIRDAAQRLHATSSQCENSLAQTLAEDEQP